jgi:hypothetical protein
VNEPCSICLDPVTEEQWVDRRLSTFLACGHGFHTNCIEAWLENHNTCPECRQNPPPVVGPQIPVQRMLLFPGNPGERLPPNRVLFPE